MVIPKIKTHTFFGKKYKIKFGKIKKLINKTDMKAMVKANNISASNIVAGTDDRSTKGKALIVSDNIESDKELLRVLVDEGLHACDERLDNDVVDAYATDISSFLWRCGYRRICKQADGRNT